MLALYRDIGERLGISGSDRELLATLTAHWQRLADSEYHIRNAYLGDRLDLFLARNEKARDLLRLPENRELALKVKTGSPDARMGEARGAWWLYIPGCR